MFAVRSTSAVAVNAAAIRRVGAKKFNPLAAHVARKAPVAKARFSVQANSSSPSPDGEVDLYRDTPLRYMGYSNEVGEAFVAFLPSWGVPASYGVAGTSRARATSRTFEISARKKERSLLGNPPRGDARRARRSPIPPRLTAPIPGSLLSSPDQRSTCSRTPSTRARRPPTARLVRVPSPILGTGPTRTHPFLIRTVPRFKHPKWASVRLGDGSRNFASSPRRRDFRLPDD